MYRRKRGLPPWYAFNSATVSEHAGRRSKVSQHHSAVVSTAWSGPGPRLRRRCPVLHGSPERSASGSFRQTTAEANRCHFARNHHCNRTVAGSRSRPGWLAMQDRVRTMPAKYTDVSSWRSISQHLARCDYCAVQHGGRSIADLASFWISSPAIWPQSAAKASRVIARRLQE